jgi:hypothetical protein
MRLPWSKAGEANISTSDPSNPALQEDDSPTSPSSDQPFSTEAVDPEKRPLPSDFKAQKEEAITFPSHPAVTPLESTSSPAAAEDEKTPAQTTEDGLVRTASASTAPGEDDESKYVTGLPLHLLTFGLTLSTFTIALDNTIIATAIPRITTVFNSLDDVGWYGSSYLLTTTSLQPSFGKIYTYFNVKWTYMTALLIFELGSVLCGAARNSEMLIVGRAVAGVGAAAMFSGGMTIVGYSVPLRKRPIYIGLLSSMFGIASVVGPILGGALTDRKFNDLPLPSCKNKLTFDPRRQLAMVLLHQPTHRGHRHYCRLLLLQEPRPQSQQSHTTPEDRPD